MHITRYFVPMLLCNSWNNYAQKERLSRVFIELKRKYDCTLHLDIRGFSGLFPAFEKYHVPSEMFYRNRLATSYLGTDMYKHKMKAKSKQNEKIFNLIFDNLSTDFSFLYDTVRTYAEYANSKYRTQTQFLVRNNTVFPVVAVFDKLDSQMNLAFEPPKDEVWIEIPRNVLASIMYDDSSADYNILDKMKQLISTNQFSNDWVVLQTLTPLIEKYNKESGSWPKYKRQEIENQITTLTDIAQRCGLDIDVVLSKAGAKV